MSSAGMPYRREVPALRSGLPAGVIEAPLVLTAVAQVPLGLIIIR